MSGNRAHSLTPLATFMTPIVLGVATWLPMYLNVPGNMFYNALVILVPLIPFVFIFLALIAVKRSRYVLFRGQLYFHALFSCVLTFALWMTLWFGGAEILTGSPMGLLFMIICGLFVGPAIFISGLVRLRGRGGWTVPTGECIRCGYSLAGLPKDTVCPECGKATEEVQ